MLPRGISNLEKLAENGGLVSLGNADTIVANFDQHVLAPPTGRNQHAATRMRVPQRIGYQVGDHALKQQSVAAYPQGCGTEAQGDMTVGRGSPERIGQSVEERLQLKRSDVRFDTGNVQPGDVEDRVQQFAEHGRRRRNLICQSG